MSFLVPLSQRHCRTLEFIFTDTNCADWALQTTAYTLEKGQQAVTNLLLLPSCWTSPSASARTGGKQQAQGSWVHLLRVLLTKWLLI